MRVEFVPEQRTVVRFPLEERIPAGATLLQAIAPGFGDVHWVAERFGLKMPAWDLRVQADRQTADLIARGGVPAAGEERRQSLFTLRERPIKHAVDFCRAAHAIC